MPVTNTQSSTASLSNGQSPALAHPPASDSTVSTIQAILAASSSHTKPATTTLAKSPPNNGQQPTWSSSSNGASSAAQESSNGSGPSAPIARPHKRKLSESDVDDPHAKIRRIVSSHVSQNPERVIPMTTVLCLHAAVAQKSYGSEKRFLCPPPVVHIEGPVWNMKNQQLSMTVVQEGGDRGFEQKAPFDHNLSASFKFLHVNGTAKSKSFQLTLEISEPPTSGAEGESPTPGRVWASFDSAPVTIISKPSKKTAKTRNIASCILAGGPVSLFNRINSQTVRTKYMTVDQSQLCASNTSWSAFNVNVLRPHGDAPPITGPQPQPVTYGSEIMLTDTVTGVQTAPLIIRKVDKGRIAADDGGPVSQMQKIALQLVNPDGTRHYLSAAGPVPGAAGVVLPPPPAGAISAGTHPLLFHAPRVREEMKDGVRIITDEVDDYLCWTIVGISKFQYTFFDAFGQNSEIPDVPITPFPTLFTAPVFRPTNNTVELTVANFFYADPKTGAQTALDIYIGSLGPLRHRLYHAAAAGPLTNVVSPYSPITPETASGEGPRVSPTSSAAAPISRILSAGPVHTIVIVDMPPINDVIRALEEDARVPNGNDSNKPPPPPSSSSEPTREPKPEIAGRSLPLLFIRASDGVGYHSGRAIACENVFSSMDLSGMAPGTGSIDTGWLAAAAQAASQSERGLHGWTMRVI